MARKGVEAVGLGKKRRADEGESKVGVARKKVKVEEVGEDEGKVEEETPSQEQVFRFMDLPGELRNRIYEAAADHAHRCFPPIAAKKPKKTKCSCPKDAPSPLPFIGLTQASSQIRSEFRPMWLSTHKIPLSVMESYLRVFFPFIKHKASPKARERLAGQFSTANSLRVWLRKSELKGINITKLLKHAVRFPDAVITFEGFKDIEPDVISSLGQLLAIRNGRWIKALRGKKIRQVRLTDPSWRGSHMQVLVEGHFAAEWMRQDWQNQWNAPGTDMSRRHGRKPEGYDESLGLGEVAKVWTITFQAAYA